MATGYQSDYTTLIRCLSAASVWFVAQQRGADMGILMQARFFITLPEALSVIESRDGITGGNR